MKHAAEILRAAIAARVPALLWGPPGIGKTAICGQIAAEMGMGFVPIAVSTRPPEDFGGLPVPTPTGIDQRPMAWVTRALELASAHEGGCLVLLDELTTAPPATQAALLSLVQSRYVGDTEIPDTVAWVAAANPPEIAADGWELPSPTVSRWVHIQWPTPPVDQWIDWAVEEGIGSAEVRGLICGYLTRSPSALMADRVDGGNPYPCPRTWEMACRLLSAAPREAWHEALVGLVGEGTAIEVAEWIRKADLPDPRDILRDPTSWTVDPARADLAVTTLLGVVCEVASRATQPRYTAAVQAICRVADAGLAGVAVLTARRLVRLDGVRSLRVPSEMGRLAPLLAEGGE